MERSVKYSRRDQNRYYLQAVDYCSDAWNMYLPGHVICTAKGTERSFKTMELALDFKKSLGNSFPVKARMGCTL
jgi:hypothetical protein